MQHYQQSLDIEAPPAAVYAALTTPDGLRGWWTRDCEVAPGIGASLVFRFGPNRKQMRVDHLQPDTEVRWLCTAAHIAVGDLRRRDEWVGTRLVFRLAPGAAGGTRLLFDHEGLVPAFECFDLCSAGWQHFLASLALYCRTGRGTPYTAAPAAATA